MAIVLFSLTVSMAFAVPIISPVSATATSEFSAVYDIGNTIDQSGLSTGFISGVTDFDTYLATNPTHTLIADDNEWFTAIDVTTATVIYDLGAAFSVDRLALWNEEFSGFGVGDIFGSLDNIMFTSIVTINPVDSPSGLDYGAQVFNIGAIARYIRIDVSGCPQPDGSPSLLCGIGEVAFAGDSVRLVSTPLTLVLFGLGLSGLGFMRRKNA